MYTLKQSLCTTLLFSWLSDSYTYLLIFVITTLTTPRYLLVFFKSPRKVDSVGATHVATPRKQNKMSALNDLYFRAQMVCPRILTSEARVQLRVIVYAGRVTSAYHLTDALYLYSSEAHLLLQCKRQCNLSRPENNNKMERVVIKMYSSFVILCNTTIFTRTFCFLLLL